MAARVSFDEVEVVRTTSSGVREAVRWDDLREVLIVTTDEGPYLDDVFWVLRGSAGGCAVPGEAAGMDLLLARLQGLPGFDNEPVIRAMGSTDNSAFVCWRRED